MTGAKEWGALCDRVRATEAEAEKYKALLKEQHRLLVESYTLLRTFEPLIAPLSNAYLINEIKTYREKVEELLR